ncbi:hypothetical protein GCM10023195_01460 [Actinoallomurus liliacearum]|uniref:DUF4440 domain-containing protein n=1 Tax=Actinoallomurus liliacearum TaxID=1080073 RepID=A0ABP8TCN9_9ACTN
MSSDLSERADTGGSGSAIQADERAVLAVFDATSRAWAEGDADAFVSSYGDRATVVLPGVYLHGKDHVLAAMAEAFALQLKDSKRIHEARDVRFLRADTAIVVTRSVTVFSGETEAPAERWELATWTLSRSDGGWLIEAYHSCPAGTDPQA